MMDLKCYHEFHNKWEKGNKRVNVTVEFDRKELVKILTMFLKIYLFFEEK